MHPCCSPGSRTKCLMPTLALVPRTYSTYDTRHLIFLKGVCDEYTLIGSLCWCRLRVFSEAVKAAATSSRGDRSKSPTAASATLAAYATGFAAELTSVEKPVIQLQERLAAHSCRGPQEALDVSLITLEATSQVRKPLILCQNPLFLFVSALASP